MTVKYSRDHEWVDISNHEAATVGITLHAQDALGDVVFVQLPEDDAEVASGDSFAEVESTKSVSDVYSPVSGVVTSVNTLLDASPESINADPYGDGWIFEIEMSDATQLDDMLDAEAYAKLVGES